MSLSTIWLSDRKKILDKLRSVYLAYTIQNCNCLFHYQLNYVCFLGLLG